MNRRLVRRVLFWVAALGCAACLTVDLIQWRADGWAVLALVAWLVMAAAFCTDVEDDPYPDSLSRLDVLDLPTPAGDERPSTAFPLPSSPAGPDTH